MIPAMKINCLHVTGPCIPYCEVAYKAGALEKNDQAYNGHHGLEQKVDGRSDADLVYEPERHPAHRHQDDEPEENGDDIHGQVSFAGFFSTLTAAAALIEVERLRCHH